MQSMGKFNKYYYYYYNMCLGGGGGVARLYKKILEGINN